MKLVSSTYIYAEQPKNQGRIQICGSTEKGWVVIMIPTGLYYTSKRGNWSAYSIGYGWKTALRLAEKAFEEQSSMQTGWEKSE